jgi:hypothetical protein
MMWLYILIGAAAVAAVFVAALYILNNWRRWKFFKGSKNSRRAKI